MKARRMSLKKELICVTIQRYWLLIFWILMNILIFLFAYKIYKTYPEYYYLRQILDDGVCISRAVAPGLLLSCSLVLLPVCRSLGWFFNHRLLNAKALHISIAVTILISSLIHSIAHVINAFNCSIYYNDDYKEVNCALSKHHSPYVLLFASLPGVTGFLMLIILLMVTITSTRWFRNRYHNMFMATHPAAILFLIMVIIHPLSGLLKKQVNTDEHIPGCLQINKSAIALSDVTFSENFCQEEPIFTSIQFMTWAWVGIPLFIYIAESLVRLVHRNKDDVLTVDVTRLPGKVIKLTLFIARSNIDPVPSEFLLLQCEQISRLEWHPFTIAKYKKTSDGVTVCLYIRARGDWTSLLYRTVTPSQYKRKLIFRVDGPYQSTLGTILGTRRAVCIAAGVGITAFTACFQYLLENNTTLPKRIHFIWIVRSTQHVLWFADLLCMLYNKLWMLNQVDRLNIEIYVTRNDESSYLNEKYNLLTSRIQIGKPVWKEQFNFWSKLYERKTIPVFVCGPKSLSNSVRRLCYQTNIRMKKGTNFVFIHDSF